MSCSDPAYDYAQRLSSYVNQTQGSSNPTSFVTYAYTPDGARYQKHVFAANASSTDQLNSYMYDDQDVVTDYLQLNGATTPQLQLTYAQDLSVDSKLARITPGSSPSIDYYVPDGLGSAIQLISSAPAVVNQDLTTAWGEARMGGSVSVADRYGFTQREIDSESSLLYFRARSLDPRTGRFLQNDPILGNVPDLHYSYAQNNPVVRVDPKGTQDQAYSDDNQIRDLFGSTYFYHPVDRQWFRVKDPSRMAVALERGGTELKAGPDYTNSNPEPAGTVMSGILNNAPGGGATLGLIANHAMGDYLAAVKMTPFVGTTINAIEAVTGREFYSGAPLSKFERGLAIVTTAAAVIGAVAGVTKIAKTRPLPAVGTQAFNTSKNANILRTNMLLRKVPGAARAQAAHHIVASTAEAARPAQYKLAKLGIDINAADNGVGLTQAFHQSLHTGVYYTAVNDALSLATTKEQALGILESIRRQLLLGTFPH